MRIPWSDGENGNARLSRERDNRVERQQDRVVTPDPDRLSAPRDDGIGGLSHCRRVFRVRLQQVNPELAGGLTRLFGEDARIGLPGVPHHAYGFEARKEFSRQLERTRHGQRCADTDELFGMIQRVLAANADPGPKWVSDKAEDMHDFARPVCIGHGLHSRGAHRQHQVKLAVGDLLSDRVDRREVALSIVLSEDNRLPIDKSAFRQAVHHSLGAFQQYWLRRIYENGCVRNSACTRLAPVPICNQQRARSQCYKENTQREALDCKPH